LKIEQQQQSLRYHTNQVLAKSQRVKEQSNTMGEFFSRQKEYLEKIEKSTKKKEKDDKARLEALKEINDKRGDSVHVNLKDLRYKQQEMVSYYDSRLKERNEKVEHLKQTLKEDVETRKELTMLRKADQEENYMRGMNIHNIYKQKLVEKLIEKRERADKIKEQQQRISDLCRTVRHTSLARASPVPVKVVTSPAKEVAKKA